MSNRRFQRPGARRVRSWERPVHTAPGTPHWPLSYESAMGSALDYDSPYGQEWDEQADGPFTWSMTTSNGTSYGMEQSSWRRPEANPVADMQKAAAAFKKLAASAR